jgi:hypothetical protein
VVGQIRQVRIYMEMKICQPTNDGTHDHRKVTKCITRKR